VKPRTKKVKFNLCLSLLPRDVKKIQKEAEERELCPSSFLRHIIIRWLRGSAVRGFNEGVEKPAENKEENSIKKLE